MDNLILGRRLRAARKAAGELGWDEPVVITSTRPGAEQLRALCVELVNLADEQTLGALALSLTAGYSLSGGSSRRVTSFFAPGASVARGRSYFTESDEPETAAVIEAHAEPVTLDRQTAAVVHGRQPLVDVKHALLPGEPDEYGF